MTSILFLVSTPEFDQVLAEDRYVWPLLASQFSATLNSLKAPLPFQQENQSSRGVPEYLRHDHKQHHVPGYLDYPIPKQNGPAGAEGQKPGHRHPLVLSAVHRQPALDSGRAELYPADVHERAQEYQNANLSSLHQRGRHPEHSGRVQLGQGHDPAAEPVGADAAVVCDTGRRSAVHTNGWFLLIIIISGLVFGFSRLRSSELPKHSPQVFVDYW